MSLVAKAGAQGRKKKKCYGSKNDSFLLTKIDNISGRLVGYCSARLALKGDVKGDVCDSSAAAELSSL